MKPVEELDALHARLEEVRREFERYFLGLERRLPAKQRDEIGRDIRRFRAPRKDTVARFKHANLMQRLMTVERYWDRILRQIEEGTYERDLKKADRHQAERQRQAEGGDAETQRAATAKAREVGDEAAAFLASLGAGGPPSKGPPPVTLRGTPVGEPPPAPLRGPLVSAPARPARRPGDQPAASRLRSAPMSARRLHRRAARRSARRPARPCRPPARPAGAPTPPAPPAPPMRGTPKAPPIPMRGRPLRTEDEQ
ncbi:MAG: hypothetical protein H6704_26230 [Myxococcales bacterium]|nr:hypothetical protein [Myxococcales bacterium]